MGPQEVIVHITDEMIRSGIPRDCGKCPVAMGIREALAKVRSRLQISIAGLTLYVQVGPRSVDFFYAGRYQTRELAPHVVKAIAKIDAGIPVKAFSFPLVLEANEGEDHEKR